MLYNRRQATHPFIDIFFCYTHQQVIYLWQFFPSNLASIWLLALDCPMPYTGASHSILHAQLHHSSSASRRYSAALFTMYASDIDCCFYRNGIEEREKKMDTEKERKIIDLVRDRMRKKQSLNEVRVFRWLIQSKVQLIILKEREKKSCEMS